MQNTRLPSFIVVAYVVIISFAVTGQTDTNLMQLIEIANAKDFKQFRTEVDPFIESFPKERTEGQLYFYSKGGFRDYGFGFSLYTLHLEKILEVNGNSFRPKYYQLRFLLNNTDSTIFFVNLIQTDSRLGEYEKRVFLDFDSTQFETYFAIHDSIFNTVTPRNFVNPPFIGANYYGPMCSLHGSLQYDEMMIHINNNRKDVFVEWLKSFNIENKVYGAHGLYFLQKKGVKLTEEEKKLQEIITSMRITKVQTDLGLKYIGLLLSERRLDLKFEQYTK